MTKGSDGIPGHSIFQPSASLEAREARTARCWRHPERASDLPHDFGGTIQILSHQQDATNGARITHQAFAANFQQLQVDLARLQEVIYDLHASMRGIQEVTRRGGKSCKAESRSRTTG